MLATLALVIAMASANAVHDAASSSPSPTPSSTEPPSSVQIVGYHSSNNCSGASFTQTALAGECLTLTQSVESFHVHPQPVQAHLYMYGGTTCSGKGGFLHTDQGSGACVSPDGYFQPPPAPSALGSVCYQC